MKKIFVFFIICAVALFTACTPDNPTNPNIPETPTDTPDDPGQSNDEKIVAVDLGLSVKWATCNVGANKPSDYGNYFAWGEVLPKSNYSENTYKWGKTINGEYGEEYEYTKYCAADGLKVLLKEDDAATVNWGGKWRMPTNREMEELEEKCLFKMVFNDGVKGWEVTGPNGKTIFLPCAGYRVGTSVETKGTVGHYWSSTLDLDFIIGHYYYANKLVMSDGIQGVGGSYIEYRETGLPIRPVCPKN